MGELLLSDSDVLRRIGRGTFGRVYLARVRDGSGGALFAVKKVLNDEKVLLATSYLATTTHELLSSKRRSTSLSFFSSLTVSIHLHS